MKWVINILSIHIHIGVATRRTCNEQAFSQKWSVLSEIFWQITGWTPVIYRKFSFYSLWIWHFWPSNVCDHSTCFDLCHKGYLVFFWERSHQNCHNLPKILQKSVSHSLSKIRGFASDFPVKNRIYSQFVVDIIIYGISLLDYPYKCEATFLRQFWNLLIFDS